MKNISIIKNEAVESLDCRKEAGDIHRRFSRLAGSEHIATEYAIFGLMKWILKRNPTNVLEIGSGIGALSFALMRSLLYSHAGAKNFNLICVENDIFFRSEMRKNLSEYLHLCKVIPNVKDLNESPAGFDFVIIDGGDLDPRYFSNLVTGAVVYFEGFREKQRLLLEAIYKAKRQWVSACFLNPLARWKKEKSSYWIYQFEPLIQEHLGFYFARLWDRVSYRICKIFSRKN